MEVLLRPDNKILSFDDVSTVHGLLVRMGFRREEVLIIDRECQRLLSPDEALQSDQKLEVRKVISGG